MGKGRSIGIEYRCLVLGLCGLLACQPDLDPESLTLGRLDIQQVVAVGDEYMAGYANEGLSAHSQAMAFPNLFVDQVKHVKFTLFRQAMVNGNGSGYYYLEKVNDPVCQEGIPRAVIVKEGPDENWEENISGLGPFHNLGVPFMTLDEIDRPLTELTNPYVSRMVPADSSTLTFLDMIPGSGANFAMLWMGTHELLAYGWGGGEDPVHSLAEAAAFKANFSRLLETMNQLPNLRHLVVFNLPDITSFPYFSTVGPALPDRNTCQLLPVYIETADGRVRTATGNDRILLPGLEKLGELGEVNPRPWGLHPDHPVPSQEVLDSDEVMYLRQQIAAYNLAMEEALDEWAGDARIHRVNVAGLFNQVAESGLTIEGLNVTSDYLTGGLFSIDGWSLSSRGNAILAYQLIESLNNTYQARIPLPNVAEFEGVVFP